MPYALGVCALCGRKASVGRSLVCDACLDAFGLRGRPVTEWPAWARMLQLDWRKERRRDIRDARRVVPLDDGDDGG